MLHLKYILKSITECWILHLNDIHLLCGKSWLTNEAEDVTNVGHEDDEQIDGKQEAHGDDDVTHPAERLIGEQKLQDGTADLEEDMMLRNYRRGQKCCLSFKHWLMLCVKQIIV